MQWIFFNLIAVRRDLCQFCRYAVRPVSRYSVAYRKHKRNGVFAGNKDNSIACIAGESREREYQAKHAGVWGNNFELLLGSQWFGWSGSPLYRHSASLCTCPSGKNVILNPLRSTASGRPFCSALLRWKLQ